MGTQTSGAEQDYLMLVQVNPPEEGKTDKDLVKIIKKIKHKDEVNKARCNPAQTNLIATQTNSGEIHIFDFESPKSKPTQLVHHTKEGYGLSWNTNKKGQLLSCSNDGTICVWDLESPAKSGKKIYPTTFFKSEKGAVNDVCWHKFNKDIFASAGEDNKVLLWDCRNEKQTPTSTLEFHDLEVMSVSFNPINENILASASADKSVLIWDLRNLKYFQCVLQQHNAEVQCVSWAPFNQSVLASAGKDNKVIIWDLSRLGQEISKEDAEDGPPEMIFTHSGHLSPIVDISWHPTDELSIATVEEANMLQIWKMDKSNYLEEKEDVDNIKDEDVC